jgi:hypothetical protein
MSLPQYYNLSYWRQQWSSELNWLNWLRRFQSHQADRQTELNVSSHLQNYQRAENRIDGQSRQTFLLPRQNILGLQKRRWVPQRYSRCRCPRDGVFSNDTWPFEQNSRTYWSRSHLCCHSCSLSRLWSWWFHKCLSCEQYIRQSNLV